MKRIALAVLAVFVAWSVMDFIIHGVILSSSSEATASLWRPMGEMNMSVMYLSVLISAVTFTLIYSLLVAKKGLATGLTYGLLFGVATGVSMGFGSYAVMPITELQKQDHQLQVAAVQWGMGATVQLPSHS